MLLEVIIVFFIFFFFAQSTGAVEYTDWFSAENKCPRYDCPDS